MVELYELKDKLIKRLDEIRNKETKTANERYEYEQLQIKLREVDKVIICVQRMKEEK